MTMRIEQCEAWKRKGWAVEPLYTHPAPQQAAQEQDAKDAARWRWLNDHMQVSWSEGKFTSLVRIVSEEWRAAINASVDRMMTGDWSDADRHALEQQAAQEPMFWVRLRSDSGYEGPIHNDSIERVRKESGGWTPLYTHPVPKCQPLTDEQVKAICEGAGYDKVPALHRADFINGIRHCEKAHGIGEKK